MLRYVLEVLVEYRVVPADPTRRVIIACSISSFLLCVITAARSESLHASARLLIPIDRFEAPRTTT